MTLTLFDIIGPVMIGPSSSHTAGAARIGRVTRAILGEEPVRAVISFHGSFEKTYRGHGTDRAVVGGLMGMNVDDPMLREALTLAQQKGLQISFRTVQLRDAHPNTLIVEAVGVNGKLVRVQAASIGGGSIRVQYLDGLEVGFSGEQTTLVIRHRDEPGMIATVTRVLTEAGINIATMKVFRIARGGTAAMTIETDSTPDESVPRRLRQLSGIRDVTLLYPI